MASHRCIICYILQVNYCSKYINNYVCHLNLLEKLDLQEFRLFETVISISYIANLISSILC